MIVRQEVKFTQDEFDTIVKANILVDSIFINDISAITNHPDWPIFSRMLLHLKDFMSDKLENEPSNLFD